MSLGDLECVFTVIQDQTEDFFKYEVYMRNLACLLLVHSKPLLIQI